MKINCLTTHPLDTAALNLAGWILSEMCGCDTLGHGLVWTPQYRIKIGNCGGLY